MNEVPNIEPTAPFSQETEMTKEQITDESSFAPLVTTEGTPYEITEEGSLGILAMGYVGIMLWRDKRYNLPKTHVTET